MAKQISLGVLEYVNTWPVYYRFLFETPPPFFSMVKGNPSVLNRYLAKGMLSASCISSIQYPFLKPEIRLVPFLALASRGPVRSVLMACKSPLEEMSGRKIYVTTASSTSTVLLKILLHFSRIKAEVIPVDHPLEFFEKDGDGCLLIGDEALKSAHAFQKSHVYDLGDLWWKKTGKPFVWAVWGIRKEVREEASSLAGALLGSLKEGLSHLDFVAYTSSAKLKMGFSFMKAYFENFSYSLGDSEQEGLLLFYDLAANLGLSPECEELGFVEGEKF